MNLVRRTEKEYRTLDALNVSNIKLYLEKRQQFYRKVVLGERVEEEKTVSMIIGDITDSLLLHNNVEDKFVITTVIPPSGQMLEFVDKLYALTVKCMDGDVVTRTMDDLLEETYRKVAFDSSGVPVAFKGKSFEKVVDLFEKDGELYYRHCRSNHGKTVITLEQMQRAEKVANELLLNDKTREIYQHNAAQKQLAIEFNYKDVPCKILPDIFTVEDNVISPYDQKVSYDVENFGYTYLKYRYDLQGAFYRLGLLAWGLEHIGPDVIVKPMSFIVGDSGNFFSPLLWRTSEVDYQNALSGFSVRGKKYTGLEEAVENIKWSTETGKWGITRPHYETKGETQLLIDYDRTQ